MKDDPISDRFPARMQIANSWNLSFRTSTSTPLREGWFHQSHKRLRTPLPTACFHVVRGNTSESAMVFLWQLEAQHFPCRESIWIFVLDQHQTWRVGSNSCCLEYVWCLDEAKKQSYYIILQCVPTHESFSYKYSLSAWGSADAGSLFTAQRKRVSEWFKAMLRMIPTSVERFMARTASTMVIICPASAFCRRFCLICSRHLFRTGYQSQKLTSTMSAGNQSISVTVRIGSHKINVSMRQCVQEIFVKSSQWISTGFNSTSLQM